MKRVHGSRHVFKLINFARAGEDLFTASSNCVPNLADVLCTSLKDCLRGNVDSLFIEEMEEMLEGK